MTFTLNIIELRYLVLEYGLSGYLKSFRGGDSVKFIRELTIALDCWDDGFVDGDMGVDDKFNKEFSTIIDIDFSDDLADLVEHGLVVLTYMDVMSSCGRYIPRIVVDAHRVDDGFTGASLDDDAVSYVEANFDAVIGCLRDMRKYLQSNERFKPELVICKGNVYDSTDKKCCLDICAFLKTEELMAGQCLSIQNEEIDFDKIKKEWKNLVMAKLIEEVATCYIRFAKKELVLDGSVGDFQHNEFFTYGRCWGAAYMGMYDELIKPRIAE